MGINIKNPEAERLIREFAAKKGLGQTEAVTIAVREALARLGEEERSAQRYKAMSEIAEKTAPLLQGLDMDDVLYGPEGLYDRETGLPK